MQRAGKPLQWEKLKADRGKDRLAVRTTERLRENAQLLTEVSTATIRRDLDEKLDAEAAWGKGAPDVRGCVGAAELIRKVGFEFGDLVHGEDRV